MNPHPSVTSNSLEKQLEYIRFFCKITPVQLCGLSSLKLKLPLMLILGRVWSSSYTLLPSLWAVMPSETGSLSELSNESITLTFYYCTKSPLQGLFKQALPQDSYTLSSKQGQNEGAEHPNVGGVFCWCWILLGVWVSGDIVQPKKETPILALHYRFHS